MEFNFDRLDGYTHPRTQDDSYSIWNNILATNPQFNRWWEIMPQNYQTGGQTNDITINHLFVNQYVGFNCEQHTFECKFKPVNKTFSESFTELNQMFTNLHTKILNLLHEKDYIRLTFFHEEFKQGIGYPFMSKNQLLKENLQDKFESIIQSYKTINMNTNNSLTAHIIIAHTPSGSGNKRPSSHSFSSQQEYFERESNYITIENEDNYCLILAVIIAIAFVEKDKNLKKLTNHRSSL